MAGNGVALPKQPSDIQANLAHADRCVAFGWIPQAIGLYRTVAMTAESRGDVRVALTAYAAVARYEGLGSDAKIKLGELQLALGQPRCAAETLDAAAHECLQVGRVPAALLALRLAVAAQCTRARLDALVHWHGHFGRIGEALEWLDDVGAELLEREERVAFVELGQVRVALAPDHVPTWRSLMQCHLERGELHEAVGAIQAVLARVPDDGMALECMAEVFLAMGRRTQAAEVVFRLARRHAQAGRMQEARRLVARGLQWEPLHAHLRALDRRLPRGVRDDVPELDLSDFAVAMPDRASEPTDASDLAELIEDTRVTEPRGTYVA